MVAFALCSQSSCLEVLLGTFELASVSKAAALSAKHFLFNQGPSAGLIQENGKFSFGVHGGALDEQSPKGPRKDTSHVSSSILSPFPSSPSAWM